MQKEWPRAAKATEIKVGNNVICNSNGDNFGRPPKTVVKLGISQSGDILLWFTDEKNPMAIEPNRNVYIS